MDTDTTGALGGRALDAAWATSVAANLALLGTPPLFDLEVASACNVACAFCPRSQMVRRPRLMDAATFQAVLDFLPGDATAMLSGLGDALLHPELAELVHRLTSDRVGPSTASRLAP